MLEPTRVRVDCSSIPADPACARTAIRAASCTRCVYVPCLHGDSAIVVSTVKGARGSAPEAAAGCLRHSTVAIQDMSTTHATARMKDDTDRPLCAASKNVLSLPRSPQSLHELTRTTLSHRRCHTRALQNLIKAMSARKHLPKGGFNQTFRSVSGRSPHLTGASHSHTGRRCGSSQWRDQHPRKGLLKQARVNNGNDRLLGTIYRWWRRSGAGLTCSGLHCDQTRLLSLVQI